MSVRRTSFHFPQKAIAELTEIKQRVHLDNNSDIIRAALKAYDRLLEFACLGYKIFIHDKNGDNWSYSPYTRFTYPGLEMLKVKTVRPTPSIKGVSRNFFFSGEAVEKLESIRQRSYVKTNADAIRVALISYKELLTVWDNGDKIIIRDHNDFEYLFNPHAPQLTEIIRHQHSAPLATAHL